MFPPNVHKYCTQLTGQWKGYGTPRAIPHATNSHTFRKITGGLNFPHVAPSFGKYCRSPPLTRQVFPQARHGCSDGIPKCTAFHVSGLRESYLFTTGQGLSITISRSNQHLRGLPHQQNNAIRLAPTIQIPNLVIQNKNNTIYRAVLLRRQYLPQLFLTGTHLGTHSVLPSIPVWAESRKFSQCTLSHCP